MKKFISMMIIMVIGIVPAMAGVGQGVNVKVNGKAMTFPDAQPYVNEDNRTMVPVRFITEALGCKVDWEEQSERVTISKPPKKIILKIGDNWAMVNGSGVDEKKEFDTKATLKEERTFVPLRFVSEIMGAKVDWEEKTSTVIITEDNLSTPVPTPIVEPVETPAPTPEPIIDTVPEITPISTPEPTPEPIPETTPKIQIPEELYQYEDNYKTIAPDDLFYQPNDVYIKYKGMEKAQRVVDIVKGFVETQNNVDYRTIDEDFINKYRYYFMPESGQGWYIDSKPYPLDAFIQKRLDDVRQYNIIMKAEFITDTSLVYQSRDGEHRVRGQLKVYYTSADQEYFDKEGLSIGQWYYRDIEVAFGDLFSSNSKKWEHAEYQYEKVVYLTEWGRLE